MPLLFSSSVAWLSSESAWESSKITDSQMHLEPETQKESSDICIVFKVPLVILLVGQV